jgi:SAM-dependent methyltransferase
MGYMREVSDNTTWNFVHNLNYSNFNAAEISGNRWSTMGFKSFISLNYPDFDVTTTKISEEYDIIIAEQVWEHLSHPYRAGLNAAEMLKPGGWLVLTVPFLVRRHDHPIDCTRWTDVGLKGYFEEVGFPSENITTGNWGNLACVVANLTSWVSSDKSHNAHQPLENDITYPVCTWGFAQKPFI